jgi:hypothetical protein
MSLVAGATTAYQADRQASKQDAALAQGMRQQGARQREANARVDQELEKLKTSNADAERKSANDQYMQQLQRTRAAAEGSVPGVVGGSDRFASDVIAQNAAAEQTSAKIADLMSRIAAPALQRQRENTGFGRLTSDVGVIGRGSAGDDFLTQLRVRGIRANPWVTAGAGVLGGAAQGMAANGWGAGTVPDSTVTLDNGYQFTNYAPRRVY